MLPKRGTLACEGATMTSVDTPSGQLNATTRGVANRLKGADLPRTEVSRRMSFVASAVSLSAVEVHPGEIVLLLVVLIAWASAVVFFIHRWRFIRILQPSEPRYRHCPKNLERVKVVSKHRDSVIYKNYSENMSRTLIERQKRLDRMNTMPNIRVCEGESVMAAARSPTRPRSESDLPANPTGPSSMSVRDLAESCTSIVASIHSNIISPVMEIEEDVNAASGLVCTNV